MRVAFGFALLVILLIPTMITSVWIKREKQKFDKGQTLEGKFTFARKTGWGEDVLVFQPDGWKRKTLIVTTDDEASFAILEQEILAGITPRGTVKQVSRTQAVLVTKKRPP